MKMHLLFTKSKVSQRNSYVKHDVMNIPPKPYLYRALTGVDAFIEHLKVHSLQEGDSIGLGEGRHLCVHLSYGGEQYDGTATPHASRPR